MSTDALFGPPTPPDAPSATPDVKPPSAAKLLAKDLEQRFAGALRRWYEGEIEAGEIALQMKSTRSFQYYCSSWDVYCVEILGASREKIDSLINLAMTKRQFEEALAAAGKLPTSEDGDIDVRSTVQALLPVLTDVKIMKVIARTSLTERPQIIKRVMEMQSTPTAATVSAIADTVEAEMNPLTQVRLPTPELATLQEPFEQLVASARAVKWKCGELAEQPLGRWLRQNPDSDNPRLSSRVAECFTRLLEAIAAAQPYALCPQCASQDWKCEACYGAGWITEDRAKSIGR